MGKNSFESKLALAGSLGLILAIAGMVLTQKSLESSRPPGGDPDSMKESMRGTVTARLWEDPFEAVQRALKNEGPKTLDPLYQPQGFDSIRSKIDIKATQTSPSVEILIVMTEGGPYAEGKEERVRNRYAIASALGVACYVPEDEERLSYVKWQVSGNKRLLPYEWYRGRKTRQCSKSEDRKAVLVLWVTSEILDQHPLRSLHRLITSLLCETPDVEKDTCSSRRQGARIKLIGPSSSSDLRFWLEEAANEKQGWLIHDREVDLYSPWATAMPQILLHGVGGGLRAVRPKRNVQKTLGKY